MVAEEMHDFEAGQRPVEQQIEHTRRVRPAIDVVADIDEHAALRIRPRGIVGNQLVELEQQVEATVDVADGVDARSRRCRRGGHRPHAVLAGANSAVAHSARPPWLSR